MSTSVIYNGYQIPNSFRLKSSLCELEKYKQYENSSTVIVVDSYPIKSVIRLNEYLESNKYDNDGVPVDVIIMAHKWNLYEKSKVFYSVGVHSLENICGVSFNKIKNESQNSSRSGFKYYFSSLKSAHYKVDVFDNKNGTWFYQSANIPRQYIIILFNSPKHLESYTLKTYLLPTDSAHLKSWRLYGIGNENNVFLLHYSDNCGDLNGSNKEMKYKCAIPSSPIEGVILYMSGKNHHYLTSHCLTLQSLDLDFYSMYEHI